MDYSLEALGQVIREHRVGKDLTQDDLGTAAGYRAGAGVSVSRIENGLTRPGRGRLEGIALEIGLTPGQLESAAAERTRDIAETQGRTDGLADLSAGQERLKDRVKRIQQEIERRTTVIGELGGAFNEAHDRARDAFFMKFVEIASAIDGAPQPDSEDLKDDDVADAEAEAAFRLRFTSYGVAHVLAGSAGGAIAGAAFGGAAAYGAFMAAVSLGTASTGAAISGLSGVAATNAALALLGGGTLAAGGAGVAGGTMLLTGIVAAPVLLLALGGWVWMINRNRKQQQALAAKLDEADAEIAATRRGFEALADILPRATEVLDDIGVHGGRALDKWADQLEPRPLDWNSLDPAQRVRYQDFVQISASQLAVATINFQGLLTSSGKDREQLIELTDEVLNQSQEVVGSLV